MMVEIIGIKCIAEMVVADIDLGCYSGIGLPEDKQLSTLLGEDTLSIKEKTCSLNVEGKIVCYRITVSEILEFPSRSL